MIRLRAGPTLLGRFAVMFSFVMLFNVMLAQLEEMSFTVT